MPSLPRPLDVVAQGPITASATDRYVASDPLAVVALTPQLATWIEDPLLICRWCGFMVKFGRGPVEHLDFCNICMSEIQGVPCEA